MDSTPRINREDTSNLTINGISHTDLQQNQIAFQPTINVVSEMRVSSSTPSGIFVNAVNGFLQDSYKASPRLTVEAGLRFEWNGTPHGRREPLRHL